MIVTAGSLVNLPYGAVNQTNLLSFHRSPSLEASRFEKVRLQTEEVALVVGLVLVKETEVGLVRWAWKKERQDWKEFSDS